MVLSWLFGLALAGTATLEVERGLTALELGRPDEAWGHALAAMELDPGDDEVHLLLLGAGTAVGLGPRVVVELPDLATLPWSDEARALRAAVASGDDRAVLDAVDDLQQGWPERPDLLAPLFSVVQPSRRQVRLRRAVLRGAGRLAEEADAPVLYRGWRLARIADDDAVSSSLAAALEARGEGELPVGGPLDLEERTRIAEAMVEGLALPRASAGDVLGVAEKASALLLRAGRPEDAAAAWAAAREQVPHARTWLGAAEAQLDAEQAEPALLASTGALSRAASPGLDDVAALDLDAQRSLLSDALLLRARAWELDGRPTAALADLVLADLLAGEPRDPALDRRLRKVAEPELLGPRQRHGGRGLGSDQALAALSGATPEKATLLLQDARWLLAADAARPAPQWTAPAVRLLEALATHAQEAERHEEALTWTAVALALPGAESASLEARRALLHEALGHREAAFAWAAIARGHGAPHMDPLLERTWRGVGDWEPAAVALGGEPPAPAEAPEAQEPSEAPVAAAPAPRAATKPKQVGEPVGAWSVETPYGTLSDATLRGRAVVFSFWTSDCGTCLKLLPALGRMAHILRGEGYDIVHVAVSLDPSEEAFEKVAEVGERWGELVRDPELAEQLGIGPLPSVVLVDRNGTVRYVARSWDEIAGLEEPTRRALVE